MVFPAPESATVLVSAQWRTGCPRSGIGSNHEAVLVAEVREHEWLDPEGNVKTTWRAVLKCMFIDRCLAQRLMMIPASHFRVCGFESQLHFQFHLPAGVQQMILRSLDHCLQGGEPDCVSSSWLWPLSSTFHCSHFRESINGSAFSISLP